MSTTQSLSLQDVKDLESKFGATLVVYSLLSKRGIPCTISNLSAQVNKMCNNQTLTLMDLHIMHHLLPSICYIQAASIADNSDDLYQLKFSFAITPKNISKLVKKFKSAISNLQNQAKHKTQESQRELSPPPHKKRRLNDIDVIHLNVKQLPPKNASRIAKQLKPIEFEPLSFIEESKHFTFWSNGNIVASKLLPQKLPQYAPLNIHDESTNNINHKEAHAPTAIRIQQIPSVLVSVYKDIRNMDIMNNLYCHQTSAIQSICCGYHNIIATSTSSGKSLIYNIAVLSHIIDSNYKSQNLYLFPTKALAQDQLRSLNKICLQPDINISCATYDGDTPFDTRSNILSNTNIILTNPDMIHQTLLPAHARYKSLFSNISFIIIDESHYYSSVFGCHFSNIIRRLKRICALYGSYPLFIGCSATINNPLQHFSHLTGIKSEDIHLVDHTQDSSCSGSKLFIFWQPPLKKNRIHRKNKDKSCTNTNTKANHQFHIENHLETVRKAKRDSMCRRSAFVESALLFSQCILSDLRCILFVKQRSVCELVYKYARDILRKSDVTNANYMDQIRSYRGGYNKTLRRQIESELFNNNVFGIVSTNAMELGIDIGDLDCTLHVGYSGLSSLWQQSGRSGRSGKASLSIFIAQNSVIDHHIIHHHEMLFDSQFENTIIYPYNTQILSAHLLCAIGDEPMRNEEIYRFWNMLDACDDIITNDMKHRRLISGIMDELVAEEQIIYDKDIQKWFLSPKYLAHLAHKLYRNNAANYGNYIHPAKCISIRNIHPIRYYVHLEETNETLDEMDQNNAFFHVFPGAIYLNQGKEYIVTMLDIEEHKAYCKPISYCKYYTLSRDRTDILIAKILYTSSKYCNVLHFGSVEVRTSVFAFYKLSKMNSQIMDEKQLKLPNLIHNTVAFWIDIPEKIVIELNKKKIDIISAIHAAEHCMIGLIPLFIKCDANQFDTECVSPFDSKKRMPRIIIAERTPDGLGYVQELVTGNKGNIIKQLMDKTIQRLSTCFCATEADETDGCLSCCHSSACHEYNIVSSRRNALVLLKMLKLYVSE